MSSACGLLLLLVATQLAVSWQRLSWLDGNDWRRPVAAQSQAADSAVSLLGWWPFGPTLTVAADHGRSIGFASLGGAIVEADVSHPEQPQLIGNPVVTAGLVTRLKYDATSQRLYSLAKVAVAPNTYLAEIWDAADPAQLVRLGQLDSLYQAKDIEPAGNLVWLTNHDSLRGYDVTFPSQPRLIGTCALPDNGYGLAIGQEYAYVLLGGGIAVVDIQNPANPSLVGTNPDVTGSDIALAGQYGFVATATGFAVVDISWPTNPRLLGEYSELDVVNRLAAAGPRVYLAGEQQDDAGVFVLDATNPGAPSLLGCALTELAPTDLTVHGELALAACPTLGDASAVTIVDTLAYVADGYGGLTILNIADPDNPWLVSNCPTRGTTLALSLVAGFAYVADAEAGMTIVDVRDPTRPSVVNSFRVPNQTMDVAVAGRYVYLAEEYDGLRVIEVTNPVGGLRQLGSLPGYDRARGVALADSYALLAAGYDGLRVIDCSDPTRPQAVAQLPLGRTLDLTRQGNLAYIANAASGLTIVDITNPRAPQILARYNAGRNVNRVAVADTIALLAAEGQSLQIISVANPHNPYFIAGCQFDYNVKGVAVSGSYAYPVGYRLNRRGLAVVDLSDPSNPTTMAVCSLGLRRPLNVAITGSHAFVADYYNGLVVVDIANPQSPQVVATLAAPDDARNVTLAGFCAYLADDYGWVAIDISDPTQPQELGRVATPGDAFAIAVDGNRLYVADLVAEMGIYENRLAGIGHTDAATVRPWLRLVGNPATPRSIELELSLTKAGPCSFDLFDVTGVRVRTWIHQTNRAGPQRVRIPVVGLAAGTYFVRARAGTVESVQKVLLVR